MLNRIKQYDWKKFDFLLLVVVLIICSIGILSVGLAGGADKGNLYMKSQIIGLVLGIIVIAILSIFDYHFICRFALIYYFAGILLTFATHTPLGSTNGTDAARWIKFGSVSFQPTELMKIIYIIFISWLFVKLQKRLNRWSTILIVGFTTLIPVLFIMSQPDLSSSLVVVFIMIVVAFVAVCFLLLLTSSLVFELVDDGLE